MSPWSIELSWHCLPVGPVSSGIGGKKVNWTYEQTLSIHKDLDNIDFPWSHNTLFNVKELSQWIKITACNIHKLSPRTQGPYLSFVKKGKVTRVPLYQWTIVPLYTVHSFFPLSHGYNTRRWHLQVAVHRQHFNVHHPCRKQFKCQTHFTPSIFSVRLSVTSEYFPELN